MIDNLFYSHKNNKVIYKWSHNMRIYKGEILAAPLLHGALRVPVKVQNVLVLGPEVLH